jgi:hypothetical protein
MLATPARTAGDVGGDEFIQKLARDTTFCTDGGLSLEKGGISRKAIVVGESKGHPSWTRMRKRVRTMTG